MSDTPTTPAGWYDDGSGRRRYWDGNAWTEHVEDPPAPAPAPAPAPSSGAATEAYGQATTDPFAQAPTEAYVEPPTQDGGSPTASYGAGTAPYGAGSTDTYIQAPTAPYGAAPTDTYGQAPTAPYGAGPTPPYAAGPTAPYGATPTAQYGAPTGYASPRTPRPADAKPSVVGLIALGIAVIGLILAFIPLAGVGAAVLLPVALVLAIVAFFLRGRKWPAITALIVSIVGGIVAVVVFLVFAFFLVGQTISNLPDLPTTDSTVAPPADGGTEATPADPGSGDGAIGTRDDPAPIGSTITGDDFTVVVNSVSLNADDQVLADTFNEPAPDGQSYMIVDATVTYIGESSAYAPEVQFAFVSTSGEVYNEYDTFALAPDPALGLDEMYNGGSTTGNLVIAIPADGDGVLRVTPGVIADDVFVAVR